MVVTGLVIASPARLLDASLPLATMRTAMSRSVTAPLHYPQFDKIKDSDFAPAFDAGMAQQLKEDRGHRQQPGRADASRTPSSRMEKSGQVLDRATTVFFNLIGTDTNDAREKLQSDYAPKFAAHRDAIALDPKLFARIKTLHDAAPRWAWMPRACACSKSATHDFVRSRRQAGRRRRRRAQARSTPSWPSWAPSSTRTCWPK
jgi:peptidyl-dipeptidase Dcp